MRHSALAAASLLVLTLAACSGSAGQTGATPSPAPNASATPEASPSPAMSGSPMGMSGADHHQGAAGTMPMMHDTGTPMPMASAAPMPPPPPAMTKIAATDAPAAFAQCAVCHSVLPGKNIIGPSLYGVYGRKAGSEPGFHYSAGMKKLDVTWDGATLNRWLTDPAAMVPGTLMSMPGVKDPAKRQAIIDYLKTLKG